MNSSCCYHRQIERWMDTCHANGDHFPASRARRCRSVIVAPPQATNCVLSDQTVVVKCTWPSRKARVKLARQEAEQSELHFDEEIDNINRIPECRNASLQEFSAHDGDYGRRVLRIIVEQELQPLTNLTATDELAVTFRKIVELHHWLYDTARILHRDISLSSLMFQRIHDTLYEILCDFDVAEFHYRDFPPAPRQPTSAGPYLAADLLVSPLPKHLYRHDLESFFYVLVFLTCKIEGSKLALWKELGMGTLKSFKESAISDGFPPQKNELAQFYGWVARLHVIFRAGFAERAMHQHAVWLVQIGRPEPAAFDDDTLGGEVTFDTFAAIIVLENLQEAGGRWAGRGGCTTAAS